MGKHPTKRLWAGCDNINGHTWDSAELIKAITNTRRYTYFREYSVSQDGTRAHENEKDKV